MVRAFITTANVDVPARDFDCGERLLTQVKNLIVRACHAVCARYLISRLLKNILSPCAVIWRGIHKTTRL